MKPTRFRSRFRSAFADMEDLGHRCSRALRAGARTFSALPWPMLLVAAILLAFILTIVPLALMLFAAFLLLKFVAAAVFGRRPRQIGE